MSNISLIDNTILTPICTYSTNSKEKTGNNKQQTLFKSSYINRLRKQML